MTAVITSSSNQIVVFVLTYIYFEFSKCLLAKQCSDSSLESVKWPFLDRIFFLFFWAHFVCSTVDASSLAVHDHLDELSSCISFFLVLNDSPSSCSISPHSSSVSWRCSFLHLARSSAYCCCERLNCLARPARFWARQCYAAEDSPFWIHSLNRSSFSVNECSRCSRSRTDSLFTVCRCLRRSFSSSLLFSSAFRCKSIECWLIRLNSVAPLIRQSQLYQTVWSDFYLTPVSSFFSIFLLYLFDQREFRQFLVFAPLVRTLH